MRSALLFLTVTVAAVGACYPNWDGAGIDIGGAALSDAASPGAVSPAEGGKGNGAATGQLDGGGVSSIDSNAPLWCQCQALMQQRCDGCHGAKPTGGAPMALVTRVELMAPSSSNPGKTAAEQSLARMQSAAAPMPPSPSTHASALEIGVLDAWIKAGYPDDSCTGFDAGPLAASPYDTPVVCTSGKTFVGEEGSTMRPGEACIACHARSNDAPTFVIAGTTYPTAHEPDDCVGSNAGGGVTVEITDKNGTQHTLSVNASGNFSYQGSVVPPYTAKVVKGGVVRAMVAAQTNGDCNSCHTESGKNGAPGRIMLP
jgi:hypothetical protein